MIIDRFTYRDYFVVVRKTDEAVCEATFSRLDGSPMRADGDPGFVPAKVSAHKDQIIEASCHALNQYENERLHRLGA